MRMGRRGGLFFFPMWNNNANVLYVAQKSGYEAQAYPSTQHEVAV